MRTIVLRARGRWMHIFLGIIGAIVGLIYFLSRLARAARDGQKAVSEVGGIVRHHQWSRKVSRRLIENLSDPREAGAILLVQMASYEGALTDAQQGHIVDLMIEYFQTDSDTAEQLLSFARMSIGEINDAANSLSKILRPVEQVCKEQEKNDLVSMLQQVSSFTGAPSDQQTQLVDRVRMKLLQTQ